MIRFRFYPSLPAWQPRNIVQSDYGYKRLQLPGGVRYVEKNTYLGIVEQSEENFFSNIYPRRTGKVSTVKHGGHW